MAEVRLQEGESLENALRRFKRKVMTEDIIKDVKRHSFYLKPGERRRVKQALAQCLRLAHESPDATRQHFLGFGRCHT
jgi:small subunit ribosomal protein S21